MRTIVIGAGHNGLAAAFYLAKAGLEPLILEQGDTIGGGAATGELHPGFRCPTLTHHVSLRRDIADDMQLARQGLEILESPVNVFAPMDDGRAAVIFRDGHRTTEALRALHPKDAEAYATFRSSLDETCGVLASLLAAPAPGVNDPDARDFWNLLRAGRRFRALGARRAYALLRWAPMPIADFASEWFQSDVLRAVVAARGISGTMFGPRSAGSTLVYLLGEASGALSAGFTQVRGGPGALTHAMAQAAQMAGATIRTGTPVERIIVEGERAVGVIAGGVEIRAEAVVSAIDPKSTFLRLVEPLELSPDFLLKIRSYRASGTVAKVNLALAGLPAFAAGPAKAGHYVQAGAVAELLSGRIHLGPDIDYLERAFDHAKYGELSDEPWLDVSIPSILDSTLSPSGGHVMSIYAHYAPHRLRDTTWAAMKEPLLQRVMATLTRFAPDIRKLVLAAEVITPLELETRYGLHGGHIFHGELALDQLAIMRPLLGYSRYQGPIPGLFLCGAGTHPGGFMSGAAAGWLPAKSSGSSPPERVANPGPSTVYCKRLRGQGMVNRILPLIFLLVVPPAVLAQDLPQAPPGRGAGPLRGPVRDVRERPTGTAVLRGRVVTADTGTAIRRAQVRAVSAGSSDTRLVTSDSQGMFEFRDLPAGRWELTASKAGFVSMRFGQRRPFEAGRPIELADGQIVERVNLSLPRGAAITGRVFDEFGDPVAGARVQAMRYQMFQGARRLSPVGVNAQSDDTGAFRLYGLMPGDYYVSAILRAFPGDQSDETNGYAPTYYPGTGSVTDAQAVSLGVSQEASISFALMPVRTARVAGRVVNSTGAPFNGIVMLAGSDAAVTGPPALAAGNRIRADGTFILTNVAPGSYTLLATSGGPGGRGGGNVEPEMGSLPLVVSGEDVTGITLVTSPGATLAGVVAAADGIRTRLDTNGMQIMAQAVPFERGFGGPGRPGRVEADGSFTLTNLFGARAIRVNGIPQGWMLDAVRIGGVDVTDTPVEFGPNESVADVEILLTDRVTNLSGTVAGPDGKPSRDFSVVVFPDDETKWQAPSRFLRSARPDQDGLFKIGALPPDDAYLAVAVDYLEQGEGADPEFLNQIRDRATRFRLRAGESATVNLKLVER